MQPYFFPYEGYYRLFEAADLFVIYDCVQFPRRGWVHRNRLHNRSGEWAWLTLPVKKCARDTLIRDLRFGKDSRQRLQVQLSKFPLFDGIDPGILDAVLQTSKIDDDGSLVDYLDATMMAICQGFKKRYNVIRSSSMNIDPTHKGQDRILSICEAVSAQVYVNAPGGRDLYDDQVFFNRGVKLEFLPPWAGDSSSILSAVIHKSLS